MAMDVLEMWRLIYQEELPGDIGPMRQLLEQYSKIAAGNVDSHLYAIVSLTFPSNWIYLFPLSPFRRLLAAGASFCWEL
jgi:hypothetical protein